MFFEKTFEDSMPYAARVTYIDSFPLHRHCEAELIYCLEGEITAVINEETVTFSTGETLFVSPLVSHSYEAKENTRVVLAEIGYGLLREDFLSFMSLGEIFKVYPKITGLRKK